MKEGYKVESYGKGTYVLVNNYKGLNQITNFVYSEPLYEIKRSINSIGLWKPKTIRNEQ